MASGHSRSDERFLRVAIVATTLLAVWVLLSGCASKDSAAPRPELQSSPLWRASVKPDNPAALAVLIKLGWTRLEMGNPFDELLEFEFQRRPAGPNFR